MTARDFCYWLQGFFEIKGTNSSGFSGQTCGELSAAQVDVIRRHLSMAFAHDIDPRAGGPEEQKHLDALHRMADALGKNPAMRC